MLLKKASFISLWIFIILLVSTCSKDSVCPGSKRAKIKNLTGTDGCGFIIELNNGSMLEPTNLSDFNIIPKDGKKIWVNYHEVPAGSFCMVGKIIEIDCLKER